MSSSLFLRQFLLVLLFATGTAGAAGPKAITKVPYEIKLPGRYLLSKSLMLANIAANASATAAITISCDDVILDLGEWTLDCDVTLGTSKGVAGIRADSRKNITIRNGTVRGFARGIYLEGNDNTGGHLVENIHASGCKFLGIQVKGRGSVVRKNRVTAVGGSTLFTSNAYGLFLNGTGIKVLENEVFDVSTNASNSPKYLLYLENCIQGTVQGNRINNPVTIASSNGINCLNNDGTLLAGNFISGVAVGIDFNNGVSNSCMIRDNSILRCGTEYGAGVASQKDGGGNKF